MRISNEIYIKLLYILINQIFLKTVISKHNFNRTSLHYKKMLLVS
jgi:hypothetical protein